MEQITITFHIQTVHHESANLIFSTDDTFADLKEAISSRFGLLAESLKIVHDQRVLDLPADAELGNANLDPRKVLVVVGKKAAPLSLTVRLGDVEVSVAMPPQRSLLSELLSRGLVTSDVVMVHKGRLVNGQLPAAKTGLQSGDVVFVHRKEAGQGAKAAAEVVDTFNHRAQQQKEEEERMRLEMEERRRRREHEQMTRRAQQDRYMKWKALQLTAHPVRQRISALRRLHRLVLALLPLVPEPRGPLRPRRLPEEVLLYCFMLLDLADLRQALKVSTGWFLLLSSDRLWSQVFLHETFSPALPAGGPRLPLECLYQAEQERLDVRERPEVMDWWEKNNASNRKAKRAPYAACSLPDVGILEGNLSQYCVDEATAYMALVEFFWACAHRDQLELRHLMLAKCSQEDSFEWRPWNGNSQRRKMVAYVEGVLRDASSGSRSSTQPEGECEELYRDGQQILCRVTGRHAAEVVTALDAGQLDGLLGPCVQQTNGLGLLDFRGVATLAAFQRIPTAGRPPACAMACYRPLPLGPCAVLEVLVLTTRYPFPDATEANGGVGSSSSSLAQAQAQALAATHAPAPQHDDAPAAGLREEKEEWHAATRSRLLYLLEDTAIARGCKLVIIPVSDQEPELADQCRQLGYHRWKHFDSQQWLKVPGVPTAISSRLAPYLHTMCHFFLDCEPYIKALG